MRAEAQVLETSLLCEYPPRNRWHEAARAVIGGDDHQRIAPPLCEGARNRDAAIELELVEERRSRIVPMCPVIHPACLDLQDEARVAVAQQRQRLRHHFGEGGGGGAQIVIVGQVQRVGHVRLGKSAEDGAKGAWQAYELRAFAQHAVAACEKASWRSALSVRRGVKVLAAAPEHHIDATFEVLAGDLVLEIAMGHVGGKAGRVAWVTRAVVTSPVRRPARRA
jgi:hypothetical protein